MPGVNAGQINRKASLEDCRYSVQRQGINDERENKRPVFNPRKIVFRSNYDRFGRIADDRQK